MLYAYIILIKIKYSSHLLYCMLVSLPYTCDLCAEKSTDDTVNIICCQCNSLCAE